jgi:hypothetical protein
MINHHEIALLGHREDVSGRTVEQAITALRWGQRTRRSGLRSFAPQAR